MTTVTLSSSGDLSLDYIHSPALSISFALHNHLDEDTALEISFSGKSSQYTAPENVSCKLLWRDTLTDDVIYQVEGLLVDDENNTESLLSRIYAMDIVSEFEFYAGISFADGIEMCPAYTPYGQRTRPAESLFLDDNGEPGFDPEAVYQAIVNSDVQPTYLVLPDVEDMAVTNVMIRALDKLNIPLDIELDPTLSVDDAIYTVEELGIDDHRVQVLWNPNVARPRDAVSVRGRKAPFCIIGQYIGKKLARNARTDAQGIPPLHVAVAGADFPFNARGMEQRPDIVLDEEALERLAQAKINVVQRKRYSIGTFFVLSDGLTQYDHKTSALRLVNAAEITVYTENALVDILHRHMLKPTAQYLRQASKDIQRFLDGCTAAGLLKPAQDLGGQPYQFKLTPDENYPFERVRLEFARRPEGMVRSVVFDSVITK